MRKKKPPKIYTQIKRRGEGGRTTKTETTEARVIHFKAPVNRVQLKEHGN